MHPKKLLLLLAASLTLSAPLPAQTATTATAPAPRIYQVLNSVKVAPGKGAEYVAFVNETTKKVAQMRVDSGEILSWTLLRSVMPAGEAAEADYKISVLSATVPAAPLTREQNEARLKKAGVTMSLADMDAKRLSISKLVSTELWQLRQRIGTPQKGQYYYLNYMKVLDAAAYQTFEETMWKPIAESWIKDGLQSSWVFATKILPSGTETPYAAYTADFYPTWESAFATRPTEATFAKVHPGKKYQDLADQAPKLRQLAKRELWVVVERVSKP